MLKLGKNILGALHGSRDWLTLLLVAGAASWLWWQYHQVRSERDQLKHWAQLSCARAGAIHAGDGKSCFRVIADLAQFKNDALEASNQAMAADIAERARKGDADFERARSALEHARQAAEEMEKANEKIGPDDRVGPGWFDALNHVAGLRPSRTAASAAGGDRHAAAPDAPR